MDYSLFEVKKNQLEMVRDRGYDISEEENILNMTFLEFNNYVLSKISNIDDISKILNHNYMKNSDICYVYYILLNKNNKKKKPIMSDLINQFLQYIQKYQPNESILILDSPIPNNKKNEYQNIINLQVFDKSQLTFNPIKHILVLKHEKIPDDEKEEKLKELKATINKLPSIKINDPIVQYYGWKINDLIRIYRDDDELPLLNTKSINYRIVIPSYN